jgi:glycosyltransferase involved in cell wall biosynthesis
MADRSTGRGRPCSRHASIGPLWAARSRIARGLLGVSRRRSALVVPRFGAGVLGGAEALVRELATGLAGRGWDVEILTTCAVDEYTWSNELPEGLRTEDGLPVRRFSTVLSASPAGRSAHAVIEAGEIPGVEDQAAALAFPFRAPGLFRHLLYQGYEYGHIVFAPYLFWTTTACLPLVAEQAVLIPCLHDEPFARLDVVRPLLSLPAACWFLSEPEHQLAHRLGDLPDRHAVTGAGVDVPRRYEPSDFRRRYGIRRPFALYAGRLEPAKGWPWLVEQFAAVLALDDPGLDLVRIGPGQVPVPPQLAGRVIDLGPLRDADRDNALAAATAYLQPSLMESFSRTMMEAWLAGTPVLARRASEVVRWHLERSGAGLQFTDAPDLVRALRALDSDPTSAGATAARGRRYVLAHYTWPRVLDRMVHELDALGELAGQR